MAWFKHWFGSPYYALLYGHRDDQEAGLWVAAILAHWSLTPGSALLDLACGRGRHARHFAAAGMQVTGVDISEESIREARERVPGASFRVHDMRDPVAEAAFDAAACLFTSLGYFEDREDDERVFHAVHRALRPGGRFVLDFMNTHAVLRDLVAEESVVRGEVVFHINRALESGVIVKRIRVEHGGMVQEFEERVLALMPNELQEMAMRAGLVVNELTDGPDMVPFEAGKARRCVLWMSKPY